MGVKAKVAAGVAAVWLFVGIVWGAQTSFGSTLQGTKPVALATALKPALIQTIPWIPVTLAVIALTIRFPLSRRTWIRNGLIHLAAAILLAFLANVLIVLGFWSNAGMFRGVGELVRSGALWATVHFHFALLIYAAVLGVTHGVLQYRETRARELRLAKVEGQLARARLEALNAQIRPHFLFNTLHTIGQLWRSGRSEEADAVLDGLGALFHKVQSHSARIEIPLAEELDLVREYLAIEKARFPDRLRPTIDASDDALVALVPPLILQPVVENAIRHGISALSTSGSVDVHASVTDGRLRLVVSDDGPGIRAVSPSAGSGMGLRNTRERLTQLYGPDGSMSIDDAPAGGTIVTLTLPASNGAPGNEIAHDRATASVDHNA